MKRPTNITIACVVILAIIAICVFAFKNNKNTVSNNVQNEENQNSNNVADNNVRENVTNEIENIVEIENTNNEEQIKNEIEKEKVEENIPTTTTETFTETPHTAEEKAIGIVQDDWNDSSAAFSVTGMDANGNYIVQVTDSNTAVLAFYTVNVGDGSFTKREMN